MSSFPAAGANVLQKLHDIGRREEVGTHDLCPFQLNHPESTKKTGEKVGMKEESKQLTCGIYGNIGILENQ